MKLKIITKIKKAFMTITLEKIANIVFAILLAVCVILPTNIFLIKIFYKDKPVKLPEYKVYYEYDVIYYTHHRITSVNGFYIESSDIILGFDTIPVDTVCVPIN